MDIRSTNLGRQIVHRLDSALAWYSTAFGDYVDSSYKEPWGGVNTHVQRESRTLGRRYYEMTDHLGNVLATVMDRKTGAGASGIGTLYSYWKADLASVQDYYPFDMQMPGRYLMMNGDTTVYRFGFNGIHKENEVAGIGNHYSAFFGEYDPRIVNRWNLDPKPTPGWSPYTIFGGNPILHNDPLLDSIRLKGSAEFINKAFAKLQLLINDELELRKDGLVTIKTPGTKNSVSSGSSLFGETRKHS